MGAAEPTGTLDLREWTLNGCTYNEQNTASANQTPCSPGSGYGALPWLPSERAQAAGITGSNGTCGTTDNYIAASNLGSASASASGINCPTDADQDGVSRSTTNLLASTFSGSDANGFPDLPSVGGASNPYLPTNASARSVTCTQTTFTFTDVEPRPGGSCQSSVISQTQTSWSIVEGWIQFPSSSSGSVTIRQNNVGTDGVARAQYTALLVSSDASPANLQFQGEAQTQGQAINVDFSVPVPTSAPTNACELPVRYVRLYVLDQNAASAARLTWNASGGFSTIPSSALSNEPVGSECGGVSKALTSGPTANANGTYTLGYRVSAFNPNSSAMTNVQVTDSLTASPGTFPAGTTTSNVSATPSGACAGWAVNSGFNATSNTNIFASSNNTLAGAGSTPTRCSVDIRLTVSLPGTACGSLANSASLSFTAAGSSHTDVSDNATAATVDNYTSADANNNGDSTEAGENDPTPATFPCTSIELTKTASPMTYGAGDVVTYTFVATNTGADPLAVRITDPGITFDSCTPAQGSTLASGATMRCTATRTMTQADVDAGSVTNTASVTGTPTTGLPVTDTAEVVVTAPSNPALDLVKTADVDEYAVGDVVTYDFVATNTGNLTLTNVSITDTGLSGVSINPSACTPTAPTTLAPGATLSCSATKTMSQADVDAGSVVNTATVRGTTPSGGGITGTDSVTVTSPVNPSIVLDKTADTETYAVDQVVTYTFVSTNTGNVTLNNVSITDTGLAGVSIDPADCTPTAPASLPPEGVMTCTATKTMTQEDVEAGSVINTATTTGTPVTGPVVSDTDDVTLDAVGLELVKTADSPTYAVGDTITYTFTSTNTSEEVISDVTISDTGLPGVTIDPEACTPVAPAVLDPGEVLTCTATKTMTQADVDAGAVINTAVTTGTPPTGPPAMDREDETVTSPAEPAIELVKTADQPVYAVDDVVTYEFVATNIGNVTLSDVSISDTGLPGVAIDPETCTPAAPATLAPGEDITCSATKSMTQADVDAGSVVNTASATGTPPFGDDVTDTDDETVTSPAEPSMDLVKTADPTVYIDGDVITYTFTSTNTGNVTLSNVSISDTGLAGVTVDPADCTLATPATLAPGEALTCTATKTMTQADVDAGSVVNTATTTGTPPLGEAVSATDTETVTTPRIELDKTADAATYAVDQVVTYTFTSTNTGEVPLTDVSITDTGLPGVTIDPEACTPAAPTDLAPGEALTCTATKTMTQSDVDAGAVINTASTSALPPIGPRITDTDDETVTSPADPELQLVKAADEAIYAVDDLVTYTFTSTNAGNVTLSDVSITDTGLPGVTIDPEACTPAAPTTLGPGDVLTCTATKTMTQADVDAGEVINTATTTGTPPFGEAVGDSAEETIVAPADPSIDLVKTADSATYLLDDDITYTFTSTNTGNVTLSDVSTIDTGLPDVEIDPEACSPAAPATLAPGEALTCTASKTMTQEDVDAASVVNTAETTGTQPSGEDVTDTDTATVEVAAPAIELVKSAESTTYALGEVVSYTFTSTNAGNVPLSEVSITDTGLPGVTIDPEACTPAAPTTLAPGGVLTCTATKTMTQADVDAGSVVNTAATSGTPEVGPPVADTDDETVTSPAEPRIVLVKGAEPIGDDGDGQLEVGERIRFEFDVTNTGNVTLDDVRVVDAMLDDRGIEVSCPTDELAPGASTQCTSAPYTVTDEDGSRSSVHNEATARACPPGADGCVHAVDDTDDVDVDVTASTGSNSVARSSTERGGSGGSNSVARSSTERGASGGSMPVTGGILAWFLPLGTASILLGAMLYASERRRRV